MSEVATTAASIVEQFDGHVDLEQEAVERDLEEYTNKKVPLEEAERSVRNDLQDEHDISWAALNGEESPTEDNAPNTEFDPTNIENISEEGEWHDLSADVIELWDPSHPDMAQVGLLGDNTDIIKFVVWEVDGTVPVDRLEEGASYEISSVVTDEYDGRYSVKLNSSTTVTEVDGDVTVDGVLVDIKSGSGLIKRCPDDDCTRVLQDGRCPIHGAGEGTFDMRIKAVVDDGAVARNVVFDQEMTEDLTGIDLGEAKDMAMDALDTSVVADEMRDQLLGQYFQIGGPELGDNILADDVAELDGADGGRVQNLRDRLDPDSPAAAADADTQQSEAAA